MNSVPEELSAVRAAQLLAEQPEHTVLLDVREPVELTMAKVSGAVHIPMAEIPARLNELDAAKTIICLCHGGMRSAHVAAFLLQQGFGSVKNLAGGIDAWATDVDASIGRY